MRELTNQQRRDLTNKIKDGYNLQEMRLLCDNLGVDWENVVGSGATREMFAEELVKYLTVVAC